MNAQQLERKLGAVRKAERGKAWSSVTAELRAALFRHGDCAELSARTGLSKSAIRNIMYGDTLTPRISSVALLLKALGYRLAAIRLDA